MVQKAHEQVDVPSKRSQAAVASNGESLDAITRK